MEDRPLIEVAGRRPFSRRVMLGGLALGALGLGLTGCAPGGSRRVRIRFTNNKRETLGYFRGLVDAFNESQSGILVQHDTSTGSLLPQFVRGNYPDIGCYNYNLPSSTVLERGLFSDLGDLPEAGTIEPAVQDLVTQYSQFEGQTNVLPFSIAAAGVVYNRDLFERIGAEVPTTWPEFTALCDAFLEEGITPIQGTFRDMWTVQQGHFDYTSGGLVDVPAFYESMREEGAAVGPDSDVSFSKDFRETGERMLQLFSYSQADALTRSYPDGNAAFSAGEAAMYLQGPWAISEIGVINPDLPVGTFPMPVSDDPDETRARVNLDLAVWVPNGVQHREQSLEFLSYLMSPDVLNAYNEENLAYSTLTDAPPVTDERIEGLQEAYDDGRFYQGAGTYLPEVIPIQNYLQEFVINENVEGLLRKLDVDWARLSQRRVG